jgi:hypothetical protein
MEHHEAIQAKEDSSHEENLENREGRSKEENYGRQRQKKSTPLRPAAKRDASHTSLTEEQR